VVCTAATGFPEEVGAEYAAVFRDLGVAKVELLHVRVRADAGACAARMAARAGAFFFTGGDQRRIGSLIAGSALHAALLARRDRGLAVAGTSAGAMAASRVMLTGGPGVDPHRRDSLALSPGLGLIDGVLVDSHFAERGRFGRLLGAVARRADLLGLGIDEDTAAVVERGRLRVAGAGAVYVIDAADLAHARRTDDRPHGVATVHGARVHFLTEGDEFDLGRRQPVLAPSAQRTESTTVPA
jgi:cyanophycinase